MEGLGLEMNPRTAAFWMLALITCLALLLLTRQSERRPLLLLTRRWERRGDSEALPDALVSRCRPCQYVTSQTAAPPGAAGGLLVNMTTTAGSGRTGNYVHSIRRAMAIAHACKARLELPAANEKDGAFDFSREHRSLDFYGASHVAHPACNRSDLQLTGNAGHFFYGEPTYGNSTAFALAVSFSAGDQQVKNCLRHYLGMCNHTRCLGEPSEDPGTLTMHVRQGDIYRSNFSRHVHRLYGQPSLALHLAAIAHAPWKRIRVFCAGEDGPVCTSLRQLGASGVVRLPPLEFVGRDWRSDLRELMCARNLLLGSTSLSGLFSLGPATTIFSSQCDFSNTSQAGVQSSTNLVVFRFRHPETYSLFRAWNNTPQQWEEMLAQPIAPLERCPVPGRVL